MKYPTFDTEKEQEFLNSRCIVRSEIAGLQGVLICTFTRYFPMLLQGGSATGCSYKLYARLLLAPYFVDESAAAAAAASCFAIGDFRRWPS